MNRPSRTDDDFDHPTWNQNPPFLAPDLTTRQDLNGIANSRVHRSCCSGSAGGALGLLDGNQKAADAPVSDLTAKPRLSDTPAMGGRLFRAPIAPKAMLGGEGQARLPLGSDQPKSGWTSWVLSVVAMSTLINVVGGRLPSLFSSRVVDPVVPSVTNPGLSVLPVPHLSRRQDDGTGSCANSVVNKAEYDVPLHVGALLIILGVSGLACAMPMIAARIPWMRIPERFFFAVRHFGTGVLLATAFVHLLPTAFISLGDPCLSSFWTTDYPAMPGAIALAGIFFVAVIEMVFSPARHFAEKHSHSHAASAGAGHGHGASGHCMNNAAVVAAITRTTSRANDRGNSGNGNGVGISSSEIAIGAADSADARASPKTGIEELEMQAHGLTPEQVHKKAILQCMMLEVGILFHSVFIGMALSVAVGTDFVVLLIAIAFHQTFEGLALGARIASIDWPKGSPQPWLMVLAYGCTTPIGQAIGLATHTLYSPDSEFGLILVGTMNAISSGLLVFASMIELLAEDFLSDESWSTLRGKTRVAACLLVLFGAICMSLVGAWA